MVHFLVLGYSIHIFILHSVASDTIIDCTFYHILVFL